MNNISKEQGVQLTRDELIELITKMLEDNNEISFDFAEEFENNLQADNCIGWHGIKTINLFDECEDIKILTIGYYRGNSTVVKTIYTDECIMQQIQVMIANYFYDWQLNDEIALFLKQD